jgi:hypothetical protein
MVRGRRSADWRQVQPLDARSGAGELAKRETLWKRTRRVTPPASVEWRGRERSGDAERRHGRPTRIGRDRGNERDLVIGIQDPGTTAGKREPSPALGDEPAADRDLVSRDRAIVRAPIGTSEDHPDPPVVPRPYECAHRAPGERRNAERDRGGRSRSGSAASSRSSRGPVGAAWIHTLPGLHERGADEGRDQHRDDDMPFRSPRSPRTNLRGGDGRGHDERLHAQRSLARRSLGHVQILAKSLRGQTAARRGKSVNLGQLIRRRVSASRPRTSRC